MRKGWTIRKARPALNALSGQSEKGGRARSCIDGGGHLGYAKKATMPPLAVFLRLTSTSTVEARDALAIEDYR
jgi:hypothetical protein